MSVGGGPRFGIVQDGLVLNLDAGNKSSYPGSGTTWFDLTSNNNNGVLTNGPTFDSANGGSIVFDGVDDYVKPPAASLFQFTDFTLASWVKTDVLNTRQFIVDTSNSVSNGFGYSYRIKTDNKIRFWAYDARNFLDTITTVTNNIWYYIVVTYNNTTKLQSIYINGVLDISNTHTRAFVVSNLNPLRIASSQIFGASLNGNIATVRFYNRDLSSTEVLQNYNVQKSKYGL